MHCCTSCSLFRPHSLIGEGRSIDLSMVTLLFVSFGGNFAIGRRWAHTDYSIDHHLLPTLLEGLAEFHPTLFHPIGVEGNVQEAKEELTQARLDSQRQGTWVKELPEYSLWGRHERIHETAGCIAT